MQQIGTAIFQHDLAGFQHVATLCNTQRLAHILFDQQDGHAGLVDLLHDPEDFLNDQRRQTHRRFIQQQDLGLCHQGTADRQHLLFTARQIAGQSAGTLFEHWKERVNPFQVTCHASLVLAGIGAKCQVFFNGQRGQRGAPLGDLHDATGDDPMRRPLEQVVAVEQYLAAASLDQSGNGQQGSALARTIGAYQRGDFTLPEAQVDAFDRLDMAIRNSQILDPQDFLAIVQTGDACCVCCLLTHASSLPR